MAEQCGRARAAAGSGPERSAATERRDRVRLHDSMTKERVDRCVQRMVRPRKKRKNRIFHRAKGFRRRPAPPAALGEGDPASGRHVRLSRSPGAEARVPQAVHHPALPPPPRCAGLRYSRLIHGLQLAKIGLDRKSLSELAIHDPADVRRDRHHGPRRDRQARRGGQGRARRPRRPERHSASMSSNDPLSDALAALDALEQAGLAAFESAATPEAVEAARIEFLGQKQGRLKAAQERLKSLEPGRPARATARSSTAPRPRSKPRSRPASRGRAPLATPTTAIDVTLARHPPRLGPPPPA